MCTSLIFAVPRELRSEPLWGLLHSSPDHHRCAMTGIGFQEDGLSHRGSFLKNENHSRCVSSLPEVPDQMLAAINPRTIRRRRLPRMGEGAEPHLPGERDTAVGCRLTGRISKLPSGGWLSAWRCKHRWIPVSWNPNFTRWNAYLPRVGASRPNSSLFASSSPTSWGTTTSWYWPSMLLRFRDLWDAKSASAKLFTATTVPR